MPPWINVGLTRSMGRRRSIRGFLALRTRSPKGRGASLPPLMGAKSDVRGDNRNVVQDLPPSARV